MTSKTTILALLSLVACLSDTRRELNDVQCGAEICTGLWEDSRLRSAVHPTELLLDLPEVDPAGIWECEPDPDVDFCVEVDSHGHLGCFRNYGGWSVAVAPECVAADWPDWLPVGAGMMANTI